jgi:hypothetical protein
MTMSRLVIGLALVGALAGCGGRGEPSPSQETAGRTRGLLAALRDTLRARNPRIAQVAVLDLRAFDPDAGRYVFVGYGVRADHVYSGSFADELFGVFVADSALSGITRTLDVFPTPRWRDYSMRISALTFDSVLVTGSGATYGDGAVTKRYAWRD